MSDPALAASGWTRHLVLALFAAVLCGCGVMFRGTLRPELFPRGTVTSAAPLKGRMALLVPPQVATTVNRGERTGGRPSDLELPIGRIVEAALQLTLADALSGGVSAVDRVPPADGGHVGTLVVDTVQCVDRVRLKWLLPVPLLGLVGDTETDVQVSVDVRLLDTEGRTVWSRQYDDGRQVWQPRWLGYEAGPDAIVRLAHEAAWRVARRVADDLRDAVAADRNRPRSL
ncbi:hypothetical protein [Ideonella sp. A 288]|uniref:hypothetical protein n=1 Tax=Ideonella sp. A 288 TaxID=1962181 RepID=UPI000B4A5A8C|nr:hypothetical protein [Ideonella sp. A 288]